MTPLAIRLVLHEGGPVTTARERHGLARRLEDGADIVPVDDHGAHRVGTGPDRQVVQWRRLVVSRVLAIELVLADENHRSLPDGGEVERLMKGADVRGPISEEGDRALSGPPELRRPAEADRHGKTGSN